MNSIPPKDAPGECRGSRRNEAKNTEGRNRSDLILTQDENAQRLSSHDKDCKDRSSFGPSRQEIEPCNNDKNGSSDREQRSINDKDSSRQSVKQDANHDHVKRSESLDLHGPYQSNCAADSEDYVWPPPESLPGPSGTKQRILSARREPPSQETEPDIKISKSIFENSPEKEDGEMSEPEELDVKPFNTRGIAVEETTEAQKRLMNIFHFPSAPLPDVAPPVEPKVEAEEPPPPKRAHYNMHTEDEQRQYVESNNARETEAPVKMESEESESEDESSMPASWVDHKSFHLKGEIFSKYDFTRRFVDTSELAVNEEKEAIIEAVEANRVVIIKGFTGCGKTTQVPQFLIDRAYQTKRPCNVVVTQPRRLAAVSVTRRVCEERGFEPGTVIGYHVGLDKKVGKDNLVTFMTTGVLLQKLTKMKSLRTWTHIIVDEVHERDLHTDLLLLFIKKILKDDVRRREKHVKVILMSATLKSEQFSDYFEMENKARGRAIKPPVIKIKSSSRQFTVEEIYLDDLVGDKIMLEEINANIDPERPTISPETYVHAVKTIINLDNVEGDAESQRHRGSVLVFLPGLLEIKTMQKRLNEETKRYVSRAGDPDYYKWDILPLHSSITNEEQRKVFDRPTQYRRKIILSTNIAESSITVSDIVYVIDFCLTKSNFVDERTNFSSLKTCWASVSQCRQRCGRTGRVRDGKVYRMITKQFFRKLNDDAIPEMKKSSLEYVVLQIKSLNMGSPQEMLSLALDAPDVSGIERAVANLKEAGALTIRKAMGPNVVYDTCDGDLTFLGEIMALLPISVQCARLIMLGYCFGVFKEAVIIAAGLNGKTPFVTPFNPNEQLDAYLQKLNWSKKTYSDCFAILHAYRTWVERFGDSVEYLGHQHRSQSEKRWARQLSVQIAQLREIRNTVEEVEERLRQKGIVSKFSLGDNFSGTEIPREVVLMLKISIAGAFYPLYFYRQRPDNNYAHEREKEANGNDLYSTVIYRNFPSGHRGELYLKHIVDALSYGLSVPFVKIEGQKVFAIFDGSGKKIGPICEGVYRAVKKRQLRQQIEFNVLGKEEEQQEWKRHERERQRRRYIPCPRQTPLPGVDKDRIAVYVTYAESPSQFWVICKMHRDIHEEMGEAINSSPFRNRLDPGRVYVGGLVLAPFRDEGEIFFYRAKVQAKNNLGQCLVYFVDYGNSDWVSVSDLRDFSQDLIAKNYHTLPCLAVESRLSETKPAAVHGSVWTEAAIAFFKQSVEGMVELEIRIYAVENSVIIGELLEAPKNSVSEADRFKFSAWLKEKNFADHTREVQQVVRNHEVRNSIRHQVYRDDRESIAAMNSRQIGRELLREYVDPPTKGKIPVTLKGPWSPIELEFQSVCNSSSAKSITVDNNSVNSIVIDHDPMVSPSRMLVAAVINIQDKNQQVVVRETTLMPAIPGILALMSLVFAPKAELRCDESMARYTGVLCGLGMDEGREPVYMDHDLEIVFDTEVDDDDIELINFIRHDLNTLLREGGSTRTVSIHRNLCERMFKLLRKNRKAMEDEIWPQESYVWDRIPQSSIKPPRLTLFPVRPKDIFQPHATVHLREEEPSNMVWDFAV